MRRVHSEGTNSDILSKCRVLHSDNCQGNWKSKVESDTVDYFYRYYFFLLSVTPFILACPKDTVGFNRQLQFSRKNSTPTKPGFLVL